jgi:hypothetical protein
MKSKIMEWNADIQKKYEALRAQRGQWDKQTASLRSDNVDLKVELVLLWIYLCSLSI